MAKGLNLKERWRVLVVGNNPIELSHVFDRLQGIEQKSILSEMAFDLQTILDRLARFRPQHILIDDNIGKSALHDMVLQLRSRSLRNVPITILKNSNYQEAIGAAGVTNYVLKQNLTSELLYRELLYSSHFLESQHYWEKAYRKRKGQLARMVNQLRLKSDFSTQIF